MILVTGASGTIGSAVVKSLQARGAKFKVALRSPEKARGAEAVRFDWDDPSTFAGAVRGVDHLFLLTAVGEKPVEQTKALLDAAKKGGVQHVVKLSVIGADAEPGIFLGRQHRDAENAVKERGFGWTFLRPTFFMQNFIQYYGVDPAKDSTVYLPHGQGKASWVDAADIGDVAAAVLTTAGHEGKAYDLTGPEALGDGEVVAILGEALGHRYQYVDVPEEAARKAMKDMGTPDWLNDAFMELHALVKHGYAAGVAPGVEQVLGRKPRSFREYARTLTAR